VTSSLSEWVVNKIFQNLVPEIIVQPDKKAASEDSSLSFIITKFQHMKGHSMPQTLREKLLCWGTEKIHKNLRYTVWCIIVFLIISLDIRIMTIITLTVIFIGKECLSSILPCANSESFPFLYWVTLCKVCFRHFLPLQKVLLCFGTLTCNVSDKFNNKIIK